MAGGYPNLKELHLTSIDFTDEFLERLLSSAMIKNLEVLNIANNNLTSRSLELLIDAQEQLSSIRMLRLNDQTDNNDNPALEAIEPALNDSLQESYKNARG
jgi:Ran GTPase-activating protein (RanGAP) involved in mRNA processing and transport